MVIFAHGSGSSRLSPRNRYVARALNQAGLGTLLLDLLTEDEAAERSNVFDIELLADRLVRAVRWFRAQERSAHIPIGLFGASTGAAAALTAATRLGREVAAVVSRGGRPDLILGEYSRVTAPTLLIVGGADSVVLELNRMASRAIPDCRLEVIPGATHLFEEPGALEKVAEVSANWLKTHLSVGSSKIAHG